MGQAATPNKKFKTPSPSLKKPSQNSSFQGRLWRVNLSDLCAIEQFWERRNIREFINAFIHTVNQSNVAAIQLDIVYVQTNVAAI